MNFFFRPKGVEVEVVCSRLSVGVGVFYVVTLIPVLAYKNDVGFRRNFSRPRPGMDSGVVLPRWVPWTVVSVPG